MITSGTPTVLGFTEEMRKKAGRQFIDVGIAEENAVALASGIAANGRQAGLRRVQHVHSARL